ncbi:hypothetical protein LCGC14_0376760 [marine sediment metagenome]|uniref:LamG-like jellyroll fold domain-containing protein n=1 Tax=marine sediment metagenome TaxID=412755 RepID=A0A0F9T3I8_9ZZZZ
MHIPGQKPMLGQSLNGALAINKGLVGAWLNVEHAPVGGRLLDLSGNSNHGTLFSTTSTVAGNFGNALDFGGDAAGDYVDIPYSAVLDNPAAFTMVIWAKSNILGSGYTADRAFLVDMGVFNPTGRGIYLEPDDDKIVAYYNGGNTAVANATLDLNWHQYVFVYNGANRILYIDAIPQGSPTSVGVGTITDNPYRIGAQSKFLERHWNGQIDHVLDYNRALSAGEITSLYGDPFQGWNRTPIELIVAATSIGAAPTGIVVLRRRREAT